MIRASVSLAASLAVVAGCGGAAATDDLATASAELARPPVEGAINGWTVTSRVERGGERGVLVATASFDDHGSGGLRSGGTCLVADLGLGACDTQQDCLAAAAANGLPGNGGAPGWFHYCVGAGTGLGARDVATRRCWSRPGKQSELCRVALGANKPNTSRRLEKRVTDLPLPAEPRPWTSLACLAGGTDPDGVAVGEVMGCAAQLKGKHIYVVDRPIVVPAN